MSRALRWPRTAAGAFAPEWSRESTITRTAFAVAGIERRASPFPFVCEICGSSFVGHKRRVAPALSRSTRPRASSTRRLVLSASGACIRACSNPPCHQPPPVFFDHRPHFLKPLQSRHRRRSFTEGFGRNRIFIASLVPSRLRNARCASPSSTRFSKLQPVFYQQKLIHLSYSKAMAPVHRATPREIASGFFIRHLVKAGVVPGLWITFDDKSAGRPVELV